MRQEEMTETHYHISKPTACFMLDLNDLKMYEDKIRTKEEQKAKEKQDKKRRRNEIRTFLLRFLHAFLPGNHILRLE
jgi:NACalpha-BTF3-like transcription factor